MPWQTAFVWASTWTFLRQALKRTGRLGMKPLLIAVLATQLAVPPTLVFAEGGPQTPGTPTPAEWASVQAAFQMDAAERERFLSRIPPRLRRLLQDIQQQRITTADPELQTNQTVRVYDRPGRLRRLARWLFRMETPPTREFSVNDRRIDRPTVIVHSFERQIQVNYDRDARELSLAMGRRSGRDFLADIEHVRSNVAIAGAPAVDPEFLAFVTEDPVETEASVGVSTMHMIRLMPLVEFTGDGGNIARHGFYAPLSFYPILPLVLPEGAHVDNLEWWSENSNPRDLDTLDGSPIPAIIQAGDLVVNVTLQGGAKKSLWVSRGTVYAGLENCLKEAVILAALREPTPETLAAVERVFAGEQAEIEFYLERVQGRVVGNDMLDRALRARFTHGGNNYAIARAEPLANALQPGEQLRPTALSQESTRPRHEVASDPDTGTWTRHHRWLQEARQADPHVEINSTVRSQAPHLIAAARRAEREAMPRLARWRRTLQELKSRLLTPTKAMIVASVLAVGSALWNPDAGWVNYLSAFGSQIYDYASHEGVLPTVINIVTSPIRNIGTFLASAYYLEEGGLNTIGSWVGTVSFYVSLLPLTYLLNWAVQRARGNRVPFTFTGMTQSLLTVLGGAFAAINRPVQEAIWNSPLLRQYNLYPAMLAGMRPFQTGRAWNAPWATDEHIRTNRDHLNRQLNLPRELKRVASRMVALAMMARRSGIDPATLELALNETNMSNFIRDLLLDRRMAATWANATTQLYNLYQTIITLEEVPVEPADIEEYLRRYQEKATAILNQATVAVDRRFLTEEGFRDISAIVQDIGHPRQSFATIGALRTHIVARATAAQQLISDTTTLTPRQVETLNGHLARFIGPSPSFPVTLEGAATELPRWAAAMHTDVNQCMIDSMPTAQRRGMLSTLTANTWNLFSDNVLGLLLFGTPGLMAYYENRGRDVTAGAARVTTAMAIADYPLSTVLMAASTPGDWMWRMPPGRPRILASQLEQAIAWNAGPQFDAMANEIASGRANPYAPLETFLFDPNIGGVVRQQTIGQGILAILRGQVDPSPNAQGILRSWSNYLGNIFKFLQAKMVIAGVPIALSMGIEAYFGREAREFLGAPQWLAIPMIAAFTSLWYMSIKYSLAYSSDTGVLAPNYGTVWPVVNTFMNHTDGAAGANRAALQAAIALLASHDPGTFREGVRRIKLIFHVNRAYLPREFNRPSSGYTRADAQSLIGYLSLAEHLPAATTPSMLLDMVFLNVLIGALGSTVMYDALSKSFFAPDADALLEAARSLGWYGATFATVYTAGVVADRVTPYLGPVRSGIDFVVDRTHAVTSALDQVCTSVVTAGDRPLLRPAINLE